MFQKFGSFGVDLIDFYSFIYEFIYLFIANSLRFLIHCHPIFHNLEDEYAL